MPSGRAVTTLRGSGASLREGGVSGADGGRKRALQVVVAHLSGLISLVKIKCECQVQVRSLNAKFKCEVHIRFLSSHVCNPDLAH
ncbi:hypothetical protein AN643_01835 [Candidatus Epulonipiscioides saccharophilum]|nr:hypothetical protein AN643_01835 [Epulopiscium sp. SCG-B10WGA-EpuloB]